MTLVKVANVVRVILLAALLTSVVLKVELLLLLWSAAMPQRQPGLNREWLAAACAAEVSLMVLLACRSRYGWMGTIALASMATMFSVYWKMPYCGCLGRIELDWHLVSAISSMAGAMACLGLILETRAERTRFCGLST